MPRPELSPLAARGPVTPRLDAPQLLMSLGGMHPAQARSWRSLRSRCSTVLVALSVLAGALSLAAGCATTPEQRAATEQAWAERDRVWAAECAQRGGRYISSSCVGFGGP